MPRKPCHARCARCIKQRKQCDAVKPRCGLCTSMKRADCIYPEGRPSRREFLEMEARQEAQERKDQGGDEMEMDVDHHTAVVSQCATNAAGRQESSSSDQILPARQASNLDEAFSLDPRPKGRSIEDTSQQLEAQQRAALIQALDAEPQPLSLTPEQIGINLANALEANAPRHVGGLFDGLSDWTGYVNEVNNMSMEDLKALDVEGELERIKAVLLSAMEARGRRD